jgi:hypothetical protein
VQRQRQGTPLIRIIWEGDPSGFAENPDNWIFFGNRLPGPFEIEKISTNSCLATYLFTYK